MPLLGTRKIIVQSGCCSVRPECEGFILPVHLFPVPVPVSVSVNSVTVLMQGAGEGKFVYSCEFESDANIMDNFGPFIGNIGETAQGTAQFEISLTGKGVILQCCDTYSYNTRLAKNLLGSLSHAKQMFSLFNAEAWYV